MNDITNHLVKLTCIILFVGMIACVTMYNICKLMDEKDKQIKAIATENDELRNELASVTDAYEVEIASLNDANEIIKEEIKNIKEEMTTEEPTETEEKTCVDVPTYTLQNTETTEEVPPIIAAATRDDYGEENYSPAVITETYDKFIEVPEEDIEEEAVIEEESKTYLGTYQLTAYCATGNPCADGVMPSENYTVACNNPSLWHRWIYIEGYGTYYCHDTGGMSSNYIIDIFVGSYNEAIQFGRRNAEIYLID